MPKKIAIVTDSTACLSDELIKKHNIYINYLMIVFGTDSYEEFKEISPSKFIELSTASKELPSTSQPAIGSTIEIYEKILAEGYEEIIHLTLSSVLSGTYSSAVSAAEMVDSEKIHIFDTKGIAYVQGGIAIEAANLAKEGKTVAEIIPRLTYLVENMYMAAAINDLTYLKKGGRISAFAASLGSLLQVKPIIGMTPVGGLDPAGKLRTFKKAIAFLVDAAKNANLDPKKDEIGILHMENPEALAQMKAMVMEIYPGISIMELPLSLVVAVHAGPGAVGLGWLKK